VGQHEWKEYFTSATKAVEKNKNKWGGHCIEINLSTSRVSSALRLWMHLCHVHKWQITELLF